MMRLKLAVIVLQWIFNRLRFSGKKEDELVAQAHMIGRVLFEAGQKLAEIDEALKEIRDKEKESV